MHRKLLLGITLMLCATTSAQDHAQTDSIPSTELQEATVIAVRARQRTPMAFTDIGHKALQQVNHGHDMPHLLSATPSATESSDAGTGIGYTYLRIRGTDPTRINITANGIPLNDAESNSIYWVNMGDFASTTSSIQVQRGIGISTPGSGAFGGNINMETESVGRDPFFQLGISGGSYGTHRENARFSTGLLNQHWGFNGRLSNIASDGYIDRASARLGSYFLQGGWFGNRTTIKLITFNGKERTYHAWDYASREDMAKHGRTYNPSGKYKDADGHTAFYKDQVDNYQQQHYQLHYRHQFRTPFVLSAALHYTRGKGYYEQMKTGRRLYEYGLQSQLGETSDLVRRKYSEADFYGTQLALHYQWNKLDATLAGGWNNYRGKHYGKVMWVREFQGEILPEQEYYRNWARKQDANISARASYNITHKLNAFADMQFRHVRYKMYGPSDEWYAPGQPVRFDYCNTFNFFNPKMGLYYDLSANHAVYASYGVGHKEPTRNDYEAAVWSTTQPRNERLNDWEAGYKYRSGTFSASANLYLMVYKDQFVLTGQQDQNGEFLAQNVGHSYRRGIELSASWKPLSWLQWDANLTWSHNRIKDYTVVLDDTGEAYSLGNTPISYSPNLVANHIVTAMYRNFRASLHTKFISRQYMTNTGFRSYHDGDKDISLLLDAYSVSNIDISYTLHRVPLAKEAQLGIAIYNIFSKKYEANGAAHTAIKSDGMGGAMAYQDKDWNSYAVYSAQAPAHFLVYWSMTF